MVVCQPGSADESHIICHFDRCCPSPSSPSPPPPPPPSPRRLPCIIYAVRDGGGSSDTTGAEVLLSLQPRSFFLLRGRSRMIQTARLSPHAQRWKQQENNGFVFTENRVGSEKSDDLSSVCLPMTSLLFVHEKDEVLDTLLVGVGPFRTLTARVICFSVQLKVTPSLFVPLLHRVFRLPNTEDGQILQKSRHPVAYGQGLDIVHTCSSATN